LGLKFAAIDVGSNAVRLLLAQVIENTAQPFFKKDSLIRIPLRLGNDAFTRKRISDLKIGQLIKTVTGFRYLMEAYDPLDSLACATSAMREADNGPEIVAEIAAQCGVDIEIVDGKTEAKMIYCNHVEQSLNRNRAYLYMDVGGGSTELTLFSKGMPVESRSFDIGTVRMLEDRVKEQTWDEAREWLVGISRDLDRIHAIGSGGNINKIFRLSRRIEGKPIRYKEIKHIYHLIDSFSYEERIKVLGLRPDRADVIVPAARIYLAFMKWAGIRKMYVPQIGLADGIVHILYEKHRA
jgi:exopolyphosphatase/guanosine-5'-triphosphate,3'-diphosphate pyrophosphatase